MTNEKQSTDNGERITENDSVPKIGRFLGGVGALIINPENDTYLLLKRAQMKDFAAGKWECVTGRVDQGEGFDEAVVREVCEEIGAEVTMLPLLGHAA